MPAAMTRLLIAASGTGGHLFPALAAAEALPQHWQTRWLGVPDRLETSLVPERYGLVTVRAGGLQGRGLRKLIQLLQLLTASRDVRRLIRRDRIRVVLHDSNAVPGRVTRLLGRFCTDVAVGLPTAVARIPGCTATVTGTPVRRSVLEPGPLPAWVPPGEGPLLLVMGGSQGAVGLNRMVRAVLPDLLANGCR